MIFVCKNHCNFYKFIVKLLYWLTHENIIIGFQIISRANTEIKMIAQKTVGVLDSGPSSVYSLSASVPIMKSAKFYFALSILSDMWVEASAKLFSLRTKPLAFYNSRWLAY